MSYFYFTESYRRLRESGDRDRSQRGDGGVFNMGKGR